jgi:hypothetical protein
MHGGKSTGPRTAEGLERCRTANLKHGWYCEEAVARRKRIREQALAQLAADRMLIESFR